MANSALPGYPTPVGEKIMTVISHQGPAFYSTGGEVLTASELGMGGFDFVEFAQYSVSTLYRVVVLYDSDNPYGLPFVTVAWYDLTGLEVLNGTDLSGEYIRGKVVGF